MKYMMKVKERRSGLELFLTVNRRIEAHIKSKGKESKGKERKGKKGRRANDLLKYLNMMAEKVGWEVYIVGKETDEERDY